MLRLFKDSVFWVTNRKGGPPFRIFDSVPLPHITTLTRQHINPPTPTVSTPMNSSITIRTQRWAGLLKTFMVEYFGNLFEIPLCRELLEPLLSLLPPNPKRSLLPFYLVPTTRFRTTTSLASPTHETQNDNCWASANHHQSTTVIRIRLATRSRHKVRKKTQNLFFVPGSYSGRRASRRARKRWSRWGQTSLDDRFKSAPAAASSSLQ